jgi:hypothetical protein
MRRRNAGTALVLVVLGSGSIAAPANDASPPSYFASGHRSVVAEWLTRHNTFRVASDSDCACDEDLKRERTVSTGAWKAKPNYHPFYVTGDFNQDGAADFAVGIIDANVPGMFRVVVFNGPFAKASRHDPAFVSKPRRLGQAMFFGEPRPKPHMLVVGAFESHGAVLRPTPKGYVLSDADGK